MIPGQKQFDTFDTLEDRREIVILFERLGEGLPEAMQCDLRARWLEWLVADTAGTFADHPLTIAPSSPAEAYMIFVHIVGVLDVPIREAAVKLDRYVRRKEWMSDRRFALCGT